MVGNKSVDQVQVSWKVHECILNGLALKNAYNYGCKDAAVAAQYSCQKCAREYTISEDSLFLELVSNPQYEKNLQPNNFSGRKWVIY